MNLNINYSSTSAAAQAAANFVKAYFEANFTDPITINIAFSFANLGNNLVAFGVDGHTHSYSTVRGAFSSHATTADDATALNGSLTGSFDPTPGQAGLTLTYAQEKALGLMPANAATLDLTINFSANHSYDFDRSDGITPGTYDFIGLVAYQISIGMGRVLPRGSSLGYSLLDAFDFSGTATHNFTGAASQAYFSLDNGQTRLGDFAPNGIIGDFTRASVGADAFAALLSGSGVINYISPTDLRELDVLGFTRRVDDYGENSQLSWFIGTNNFVQGNIDYTSDVDWFRSSLIAGRHYRIELNGSATSQGSNTDPVLALYNANSAKLAENDDSGVGTNSLLYFTPSSTGFYYLEARNFSGNTGTYTMKLTETRSTPSIAAADFDRSFHNDILWRNDNGTVSIWDDGAIGSAHVIAGAGIVPAAWQIINTGDFAGDGKSDILWRRSDGTVSIWDDGVMANAHVIAGTGVNGGPIPTSWRIVATGDFDGNGKSDILWRKTDGSVSIWDDGTVAGAHTVSGPGVVSNTWHVAGIANFDVDNKSDILWRNENGAVSTWLSGRIDAVFVMAQGGDLPAGWHIAGVGDFDGNTASDILWRHDNGTVSIWDGGVMSGAHIISGPGVVPNSWQIETTGDFDANGKSDILWRNTDGSVSIWDDGAIGKAHTLSGPGVVSTSWHIQHQQYDLV